MVASARCHVDTFTSNFYPSRQSPDRAAPVGVFDTPKAAVATWTQRNRTARRHPRRRERLVDQAEAGRRSRVVQCSRALRPASAAATSATAKSLRLDRGGVASINGLPRSPSAAAARTRRARRRCYSTPSPPRVASGRRAAPSVSSRSLSRRARRSCARLSKRRLCRCASPWLPRVDFDEGQPDQALRWAKYITGPVRELGLGACRLYAALCQLSPDSALSECGAEGA